MNSLLRLAAVLAAAALALGGCGLKGALTMPSQSEEIVIRPAPGATTESTTPDGTTATPPPGETTPAAPATAPVEKKIKMPDDRLPPPPLPGGNPGTARSG